MVFHCFCSFFPVSMPLSLAFPMVSFLPQCHFHHVADSPGTCQAHSTKTTKPKLSVVNRLAYPWPLQNLSVSMSVMNKVATLALVAPATCFACLLDLASGAVPHPCPCYCRSILLPTLTETVRSSSLSPYSSGCLLCGPPLAAAAAAASPLHLWKCRFWGPLLTR